MEIKSKSRFTAAPRDDSSSILILEVLDGLTTEEAVQNEGDEFGIQSTIDEASQMECPSTENVGEEPETRPQDVTPMSYIS